MYRSNPEPVFLTSKSFTSLGAGALCYAFYKENQCVISSCYTRYSVALRFLSLFSNIYSYVLQNGISRAYMCACASARAYTRAPTRVHSCYIATSKDKSLKINRKSVAGLCSRRVVCPCYTENDKILGIYSAEKSAGAGLDDQMDGSECRRGDPDGRIGAGRVVQAVADRVLTAAKWFSKKWRISAVFGVPFNGKFNVMMFNVCDKWRSSAFFRAVGTFFLKMCAVGKNVRSARIGYPGGSPPNRSIRKSICRERIFFRFPDRIVFLAVGAAVYFFMGIRGIRVFGS